MNKTLLAIGSIIGVLVLAIVALYFFGAPSSGGPELASSAAMPVGLTGVDASVSETDPSASADGGGMGEVQVTGTEAPEPDPNVPLAIQIPGCVCHSDDPKVVKEHEKYRMNQCAGCHAGETPTGQ